MRRFKNLIFYIATIGGFSLLIYWIAQQGDSLEKDKVFHFVPGLEASNWSQFQQTFLHNLMHPLAILLLQIITIIIVAKIFGYLCRKIGQPSVVGEIAAGIILGPSFIGNYFPEFSSVLFPPSSLGNLQFLSQIGLILFMFVVGMELDLKVLKNKAHEAVVVSHASIIIPFALGMGLALFLYDSFAPQNVKFVSFSLFMGIAMSVTAFPVLARIVHERGLNKTRLGAVVITCAAADDITAWCILAAVIAIVKAGSFISALYTILMAIGYVLLMLAVIKPFLQKLGERHSNRESLSRPVVGTFFIVMLLSSYATEVIGIHALFGAFMAGVIMPSNLHFRNLFASKVEDVALVLLLPLFFVFTGLRTQIGLLDDIELWKICGVVILVAVTGKFIGSALAARFVGQNWRESLMIGALMNTRGLMELVVLNIGYDLGVLSPEIFAMMVIMALVTTVMTGPALDIINFFFKKRTEEIPPENVVEERKFKILVAFGNYERGRNMLRLANSMVKKSPANAQITMMHLVPGNQMTQMNAEEYEEESFRLVRDESLRLNQPIVTLFKPSPDIDREIAETANLGNFDLMFIGIGHSIYEGSLLGKILGFTTRFINPERIIDSLTGKEKFFENTVFDERTKQIVRTSRIPIGILLDKGLTRIENVFLPFFSLSDSILLTFAQKLITNADVTVTIIDAAGIIKQMPEINETIKNIEQTTPGHLVLHSENIIEKEFLARQDLMLINIESWKRLIETKSVWLTNTPSVLIFKP